MHWIVERHPRDEDTDPYLSNITKRKRDDVGLLIKNLEALGVKHTVVRKPPFADYLVSMHSDEKIEIEINEAVFAYGSTTLHDVAKKSGWLPGYFDAPQMHESIKRWGKHMLNFDAQIFRLSEVPVPDGPIFIRPDKDDKSFAGEVKSPEEFREWRNSLFSIEDWKSVDANTLVWVGGVKKISAEWRVAVISGKVVTGSMYRQNGMQRLESGLPQDVVDYVSDRIQDWNPREAYVIDIADHDGNLKIIETNSISSSGFYEMNQVRYIKAIEKIIS
jgi:hypothetical protein